MSNNRTEKVFPILLEFFEDLLNKEEINIMLSEADVNGSNVLHLACLLASEKTLQNLLEIVESVVEFSIS